MKKHRICIADDHEIFRMGVANMIDREPDLEVVGQAADGFEILSTAREQNPDLVLMDISMPVCDGIEGARLLREAMPDVIILMFSILHEREKLIEALKAGANGYVLKNSTSAGLLRDLRAALQGHSPLPVSMTAMLIEDYRSLASSSVDRPAGQGYKNLTRREKEVLQEIQTGASNQEIAASLNISLYTVKSHVRSILEKFEARNRWQAVAIAEDLGIINKTG